MTRTAMTAAAAVSLAGAAALGWLLLRPATPVDTPYFHWQEQPDRSYALVVAHANANPEFRQGVTTTPVPRSGELRVVGEPGATDAGALVEVSNPRTGKAQATMADAQGAFALTLEVRRGDALSVISRRIQFRAPAPPRYSSASLSSP